MINIVNSVGGLNPGSPRSSQLHGFTWGSGGLRFDDDDADDHYR